MEQQYFYENDKLRKVKEAVNVWLLNCRFTFIASLE